MSRLLVCTGAFHLADHLALAALPLVAVLTLGASPGEVGALVACQGAAWLVGSLPAGVLVDRHPRNRLVQAAHLLAIVGLGAALAAVWWASAPLLGAGAMVAALGTVLFLMAGYSAIPALVNRERLATVNGRMEIARSVPALLVPLAVGLLAERGMAGAAFAAGIAAILFGLVSAARLPRLAIDAPRNAEGLGRSIAAGARFVLRQPLLRAIALCAMFWNLAFFALLAAFVPFALDVAGLPAWAVGGVQSGYGLGTVLGALTAARTMGRFGPNAVLVAGPTLSVAGAAMILLAGPGTAIGLLFAGQFLLGFGPMQWLVCQNAVRQTVTPTAMLGRVTAVIQVAIYGIRPLGALAGGWLAGTYGPRAAVACAVAAFLGSFLVAALGRLARLRELPGAPAPSEMPG